MGWRRLLVAFLVYSLVDGFFSNMLFPATLPLLFKDFLLILVFLAFLMREDLRTIWAGLIRRLGGGVCLTGALFLMVCIVQIFNPKAPSLLLGLLGFKILFLYWLLIPLGYAYVQKQEDAVFLIKVIAGCSILVNIFGMYQFFQGPDFLINRFGFGFQRAFLKAALDSYGMGIESYFRVIGSFASAGQYANFLDANAVFCFALVFESRTTRERMFWIGAEILNFFALFAAGSRGAVLFLIPIFFLFVFFSRSKKPVLVVAFVAILGLLGGLTFLGKGVQARFKTLQQTQMIQERTVGFTKKIFSYYYNREPMGRGLGSASTAARYLYMKNVRDQQIWVENFPSKLQVETGAPGVATFFLFLGVLLFRWSKDWLSSLTPRFWNIAFPISSYAIGYFVLLSFFGILDTTPAYIYIWLILGMILKMVDLSEEEYLYGSPPESQYLNP